MRRVQWSNRVHFAQPTGQGVHIGPSTEVSAGQEGYPGWQGVQDPDRVHGTQLVMQFRRLTLTQGTRSRGVAPSRRGASGSWAAMERAAIASASPNGRTGIRTNNDLHSQSDRSPTSSIWWRSEREDGGSTEGQRGDYIAQQTVLFPKMAGSKALSLQLASVGCQGEEDNSSRPS
ncbi:hypothetical protein H696_00086 [Fonticula alba]|uniref:Uncharacterized protein n=1 Tax=Fonticula alba TaxID=691883 RepID=A0A058ZDM2_FONAL|nr:hypothetical protein H696_00086 [Fonticula alba]KCV72490.1 hypothetical protein H696_00086 [Fonticula alba]|eukprot:XP_009492191.1 hypothetical protein H696_00086 [Fonticula alba]